VKTRSFFWDRKVLGCGRDRIFARGVLVGALFISALVMCPAVQAQEGANLTDAKQKRSEAKNAKKLQSATKKPADRKTVAKPKQRAKEKSPKFSLPVKRKPAAGQAGSLTTTATDSTKKTKTSAQTEWKSSCGKDKTAKGNGSSAASKRTKGTFPKLAIEQVEVSKKPVWYGEMIECEWVLKNEGDVTLSVTARGG